MALNIAAIREALAAQIKANVSTEVNVYAGYRPASPQLPCVIVLPADDAQYVEYEGTLQRPTATIRFSVQVLTRPGISGDGQRTLDGFISSGAGADDSIIDAIRVDRLLGGAVISAVVVTGWDHRGQIAIGDGNSFAEWASLGVELFQHA